MSSEDIGAIICISTFIISLIGFAVGQYNKSIKDDSKNKSTNNSINPKQKVDSIQRVKYPVNPNISDPQAEVTKDLDHKTRLGLSFELYLKNI